MVISPNRAGNRSSRPMQARLMIGEVLLTIN